MTASSFMYASMACDGDRCILPVRITTSLYMYLIRRELLRIQTN
jgi:hypothetical protein